MVDCLVMEMEVVWRAGTMMLVRGTLRVRDKVGEVMGEVVRS